MASLIKDPGGERRGERPHRATLKHECRWHPYAEVPVQRLAQLGEVL